MLQILHILNWFEKNLQNREYLSVFPEVQLLLAKYQVLP